jgi:hypothetical protein
MFATYSRWTLVATLYNTYRMSLSTETIYENKTVWTNEQGLPHREDGHAIEYRSGSKLWCLNGYYHREDGPAIEWVNGTKEWWINGHLHREDGPAIVYDNGYKEWYTIL